MYCFVNTWDRHRFDTYIYHCRCDPVRPQNSADVYSADARGQQQRAALVLHSPIEHQPSSFVPAVDSLLDYVWTS